MGRKKIQISRITDERNRQVTFNKRKFGVMKKAYELSVLCDCEIALIIFSSSNKLYQYASTDMDKVLLKYTEYNEPHESLTNKNIIEVNAQKENKNGTMSPDSPEPEDSYTLTPRTEAKYNKIDEDFQIMMQRNQQLTAGGTRPNMATNSYSLPVSVPVSVPVIGTYNDSMLQSSPQMAHNSISPRPSSSETDSVYPSGGILEMSNGYPHSASPLGGSPSPGPSPVQTIKQSPSGGSGSSGSRSLRVVIPAPMNPTITADDISYVEHTRQQTNLNTPVVALQTPIPGLTNYTTTLGSFGAQDFSLNPDIMIGPWSAASSHSQNTSAAAAAAAMGSLQHSSGLPHLAVSNSTPPPSTSPLSVKIKAEPISPPRDHHNTSHHHGGAPGGGSSSGASGSAPGANGVQSASGGGASSTATGVNANSGNNSSNNNGSGNSQQQNGAQQLTAMGNVVVTGGGGGGGGGGGAGTSTLGANLNHSHLIHSRPSSTGHLTPTPDSYMPIGGHLAGSVTPTNAPSPTGGGGGGGGGGAGSGNRGADGSACYLDDNSNHVVVISDADGSNTSDGGMGNSSVTNFTHKLHQHLHGHGGSAHQYHHHHLQQQQQHHHHHQQQQQHSSQLLHPFYNQHHHHHHLHVQQQHHQQQQHHAGSSGNNSNHGYSSQPTSPYHNHNSNSSEPKHLQGSHSPSPGVTPGPSGSVDGQSQAIAMQQHY
uniref:MADS-box domain-containing protein n=1 Tax=Anopheles quadriannulatus TaxID=34691 RepID=A0A182XJ72_ANOQN